MSSNSSIQDTAIEAAERAMRAAYHYGAGDIDASAWCEAHRAWRDALKEASDASR